MKAYSRLLLLLTIGILGFAAKILLADNITLTTYYPAPFGVYDRLRLAPRDSLSSEDCKDSRQRGTMYYDNGLGERSEGLYICQDISPAGDRKSNDYQPQFDWTYVSRPKNQTRGAAGQYKVLCVKTDGSFGECLNNPSADGTCGCE